MSISKLIQLTGKPVLCDVRDDLFWVTVDEQPFCSPWSFNDASLRAFVAIKADMDEAHEDYKRHIEHGDLTEEEMHDPLEWPV